MRTGIACWIPTWGLAAATLILLSVTAPPSAASDALPDTTQAAAPLRQALAEAWRQHPAALSAERKLAAARARAIAAGGPIYNPEVELAADDEGPDRIRTVGLSQTLDLSGKRRARRAVGDAELAGAEARYTLQSAEFARDWLTGWTKWLAARRQVELGEQRVALAERLAGLAERQRLVGDISSPERDLVLLTRDEALAEQATLLADSATAEEAFTRVGGNAGVLASLRLPEAPPPITRMGVEGVVTGLPEFRVSLAEANVAQQRIAVADRDRRPDPTVSLRGGRIDMGEASGSVIGMSIAVPLFVRNSYRAEAVAARADAAGADADMERLRLELQARAESAARIYIAVREAWAAWHRSRGTDLAARSNALERLWQAGELSTADYVLQIKQTLDTALAGAALDGRVWQSYFDYLYAVGQLDEWSGLGAPP
ncbi:MAG: TolC family protein [Luteimonas sp.]